MNILVGICGLGNGHATRQHAILEGLLERDHNVALFTHRLSARYFSEHLPKVAQWEVWIPMITPADKNGLCYDRIAKQEGNREPFAIETNYGAMDACLRYFSGSPDLVITDYEPNAAQFAYSLDAPLLTIDNQSICIGFEAPEIEGFGPSEESARLRLFFPKADRRIVLSWLAPQWTANPRFPVELAPPIVRPEVLALRCQPRASDRSVLVYLSPYEPLRQTVAEIIGICEQINTWKFLIFTSEIHVTLRSPNVELSAYDTNRFLDALTRAHAVIATAGFSLLTECLSLEIPIYAVPMKTYEQHLNAYLAQSAGVGTMHSGFSYESIGSFLEALPAYRTRLRELRATSELMETTTSSRSIVDRIMLEH